ncbi:hypothetical protein BD779DRAFT_1469540 [Infundibulicybe gibba]|nr:hypothetical protein BD779DRAFT_1469540 [Infundibulicybe gibba]
MWRVLFPGSQTPVPSILLVTGSRFPYVPGLAAGSPWPQGLGLDLSCSAAEARAPTQLKFCKIHEPEPSSPSDSRGTAGSSRPRPHRRRFNPGSEELSFVRDGNGLARGAKREDSETSIATLPGQTPYQFWCCAKDRSPRYRRLSGFGGFLAISPTAAPHPCPPARFYHGVLRSKPESPFLATISCGNTACDRPAIGPGGLRCPVCLVRSYCSTACKEADFPIHSTHCSPIFSPPNSLASALECYAKAFVYRYSQCLIPLALATLRFQNLPNSSYREAIWNQQARNNVLVVYLQKLQDMPVGTPDYKQIAYKSSGASNISFLDGLRSCKEAVWKVQEDRAPAVTIGLIVSDEDGRMVAMITSTHSIAPYSNDSLRLNPNPEAYELFLKVSLGRDM